MTGVDDDEFMGMYVLNSRGQAVFNDPAVCDTIDKTNSDGIFSFGMTGAANGSDFVAGKVATLTFTATAAGTATLKLTEESSTGPNAFSGLAQEQTVTILAAPIPAVTVTGLDDPAKNGTPDTEVTVDPSSLEASVEWYDGDTKFNGNKFAASTAYTAKITLTAKDGDNFASDVTVPEGFVVDKENSTSTKLVLTKTFDTTDAKVLTDLEITSQPTKTDYIVGDTFDTTGMVVKATYDDGSTDDNFTGYTVTPATLAANTDKVIIKAGDKTAEVDVTVRQNPALNNFDITIPSNAVYNGSAHKVTVAAKDGVTGMGAITVQYNGSATAPTDAGTYTVTFDVEQGDGYAAAEGLSAGTLTIAPKTLTKNDLEYTGAAITKEYDGNTSCTLTQVSVKGSALVAGDTLTVTGSAVYNSANVSEATKVTFTPDAITSGNYALAATETLDISASITAKPVGEDLGASAQTVVKGVGDFVEPTFGDITGSLKYTYNGSEKSYAEIKSALAALAKDATGSIGYTYTANGNYSGTITGTINFTIVDVSFEIAADAITKNAATYGMTWDDIIDFDPSKITAKVGDYTCANPTFTLVDSTGVPDAGDRTYTITFSGEINGKAYTGVTVTTGTVNVAKATVTVTAGDYKVSKVYDGGLTSGTATGTLAHTGILDGDTVRIVPTIPAYTNANVGGQSALDVAIALRDDTNYQLAAATVTVPCEITKKDISISSVDVDDKLYDGTTAASVTAVTFNGLVNNEALTFGTDFEVTSASFPDADADAANVDVAVTVALKDTANANNYSLTSGSYTAAAKINKIAYTEATPDGEAKYGNTGSVTLDIAPGATATLDTVTDSYSILDGAPTVADGKLNFKFKDTAVENQTATVRVSVSEGTNHLAYPIEVTLTVLDKLAQSDFQFAAPTQSKSYGDGKFTVTATGAVTGSSVTYASSDETVATVDPATGEVTIRKAGTVTITATASATNDYATATASYTLTVAKAKITIKANNQTIYLNGTYATDATAYTVTGLVGEDALGGETAVKFYDAEGTEVTPDVTKTGTYTIKVSGASVPTIENYEELIEYVDGTLTIRRRSSGGGGGSSAPVEPEDEKWSCDGGKKCPSKPFIDVNTDLWYHQAVDFALTKGFMVGLSENTFGPEVPVTRGMVVTVLWSIEGAPSAKASAFQDVAADAWYAKAVNWASANGIVAGYSADAFGPEDLITREQMATILRAYAYFKGEDITKANDLSGYADVDQIADWAETSVAWANAEGLMAGRSATELAPKGTTKRAELAAMLMGFLAEDK